MRRCSRYYVECRVYIFILFIFTAIRVIPGQERRPFPWRVEPLILVDVHRHHLASLFHQQFRDSNNRWCHLIWRTKVQLSRYHCLVIVYNAGNFGCKSQQKKKSFILNSRLTTSSCTRVGKRLSNKRRIFGSTHNSTSLSLTNLTSI